MHFVEAKGKRHRKLTKELEHISIHGNENADGHLIVHHHSDGSEEHYEFGQHDEGERALAHIAHHANILPSATGESEQDEGEEEQET